MTSNQTDTRPLRALWDLIELARDSRPSNDGWLFALAWLAAAKLTLKGLLPRIQKLEDLLSEQHWNDLAPFGLPEAATALVWRKAESIANDRAVLSQALAIVAGLADESDGSAWDVLDAPWQLGGRTRSIAAMQVGLCPDLADMLVAALEAGQDDCIWVPFDPTGQLVIRAARLGAMVLTVGPHQRASMHVSLLLALEGNPELRARVIAIGPDPFKPVQDLKITHILAMPPIGMRVPRTMETYEWERVLSASNKIQGQIAATRKGEQLSLDRFDSWVLALMWPLATKRGVFVMSPSILYAKGQEQRLREELVWGSGGNPIMAIANLPQRLLAGSNFAPVILILDRTETWASIRMVDAIVLMSEGKLTARAALEFDGSRLCDLLLNGSDEAKGVINVRRNAIDPLDLNLQPTRYLKRLGELPGPRVVLGELVTVVRAPVVSQEIMTIPAWEIGFPYLDRWKSIAGPFNKETDKHVSMKPRKAESAVLREGDLLVSIKGTLGKVGLIGAAPEAAIMWQQDDAASMLEDDGIDWPFVAAQSCIALRMKSVGLSPKLLMLYLRSKDFIRQLDSLRKGASVAHVTPAVLLQEIQVPVISSEDQNALLEKYDVLCHLEDSIATAQTEMKDIQDSLWPLPEGNG